MKAERGRCHRCGKKTAARDGEAADGRPQYRCLNGHCEETWTKGHQGEAWDTTPSPTRRGLADQVGLDRSPWSGLCVASKHGLDFEGQVCDLCAKDRHP